MTDSFELQIAKFAKFANRSVEQTAQAIVIELFGSVIMDTPVGNPTIWKNRSSADRAVANGYTGGRLRGNWMLTDGAPSDNSFPDQSGHTGIARANAMVKSLSNAIRIGSVHYLTNNLPYAMRVEYGHSTGQAPAGMVRKNAARIVANIDAVIRENSL